MAEEFNWMRKTVEECKGTTCEVLFGWGLDRGKRNPDRKALADKVFKLISSIVKDKELGVCLEWPVDVVLSDRDLVHPDVVFVDKDKAAIVHNREVKGSPTLIVEILENENDFIQLLLKTALYEKYEVQELWIIDPFRKEVNLYIYRYMGNNNYLEFEGAHGLGDAFVSESLSNSEIEVNQLFGGEGL